MIRKIRNWFNVEPTGESFWDSTGCVKVYVYRYKHDGKEFLTTGKYSFFRVDKDE
jgi:hypothetical protein